MTIARAAAIGSLIVAIVAVGILMFGSGGGTEYTVHVQSANQLVKGNEVKVGGLAVGEITDIQLSEDNQADVKVEIKDEDFAPLHEGTEATVRVSSLPSVANRYISLHPGPNNAPEIDEGGISKPTRRRTRSTSTSCSTRSTRRPARDCRRRSRDSRAGTSARATTSRRRSSIWARRSGNFTKVMQELGRDQKAFTDLVVQGARATSAIAERRDDLSALVANGSTFARAIAAENESFDRALAAFPDVLQEGSKTFVNLRGALVDLNELTNVSKPLTKSLEPYLRDLSGLLKTMRPTFKSLRLLVNNPGPHNDSADILRRFPSLEQLARKSTKNSVKALKAGQDEVEFLRPYAPDISAWLTHFAQVPAYYDANGHWARVLPMFNAFSYDASANQLNALSPAERSSAQLRGGNRFCPGAATQPAPDGSNPFTDDGKLTADDCDPSQRPVGP